MKNYKVTVNGTTYEVGVEEAGGTSEVKSVAAVPVAVAAPKVAPVVKPAPAPKQAAPAAPAGEAETILAPLPGVVLEVKVKPGDAVKANQELVMFEAMKMENEIVATRAGTVKEVFVKKGDMLDSGTPVVSIA
ncbi:MAG: acetyl-CoA carboxylase biotin carboxyl carrier protein subunit [Oscillospiraceae bacterium]|nr:acetyl-CoA carboxylase biotin carboxyl carrier protein subunit [Oscillospiraceae bacterium]